MNEKIRNNPGAAIIGGVVVIVLVSFSLMIGGGMMSPSGSGMMNGFGFNGWSWWTMLLGSLGMVAFWIALVWVVVLLSRRNSDPANNGSDNKLDSRTNLELLQHRLASGEITQVQYDSARRSLGL